MLILIALEINVNHRNRYIFNNFFLRVKDCDPGAAKVGFCTDYTCQPKPYPHPDNPNIIFWDLPGIGTDEFPAKTYCQRVDLKKYDSFLIFTANRFRREDSILAEAVSSIGKKFFFVRSKIDQDVENETDILSTPESFNETDFLEKVRVECLNKLGDRLSNKQHIFLISNKYPKKWDFKDLAQVILDILPTDLSECLTLSLGVLKSLSTETLERKVAVLKRRIWLVAGASAAVALVPIPGVSTVADLGLIVTEMEFYRSQLGLPKDRPDKFEMLTETTQVKAKMYLKFLELAVKGTGWLVAYGREAATKELVRFLPFALATASAMSCGTTYYALLHCLETMADAAFAVLCEATEKTAEYLPDID